MKKFVLTTLAALVCAALSAQVYTEASDLTLIGKIIDTPNPYHRVDTVRYKGFTKAENQQVRSSAGLAVLFRTDSPSITVKAEGDFSYQANNTMRLASHGFDLYIRKDGEWLWAAACCPAPRNPQAPMDLIKNMAPGVKECLLYLPIYSELTSLQIGVEEGRMLAPMESPFRHRVAIFGSSYTHGISTSRAGMSYPDQFTRHTGIQMLSLGCSGNCKMQPYFAAVLEDVEADAFVFDAFSNLLQPQCKDDRGAPLPLHRAPAGRPSGQAPDLPANHPPGAAELRHSRRGHRSRQAAHGRQPYEDCRKTVQGRILYQTVRLDSSAGIVGGRYPSR